MTDFGKMCRNLKQKMILITLYYIDSNFLLENFKDLQEIKKNQKYIQ